MKNLCIYHANCPDGWAAAVAVYRHWGNKGKYYPAQYQQDPPDVTDKNVLIVDFSYPREVLLKMKKQASALLVIDHHKSAKQDLDGLDFCIFDMNKSGCVLTWEYLFDKSVPLLFQYIEDRDLGRIWHGTSLLTDSKAVNAGLRLVENNFEVWLEMIKRKEKAVKSLMRQGVVLLEYWDQCVEIAMKQVPHFIVLGGYMVPCLNVTHLKSEICNKLAEDQIFAAVYKDCADKRVYDLRSDEKGLDVSEIAKRYGGGGHKHAAGFIIDRPKVNLDKR